MQNTVYWLRLPTDTDPYKQGYVGITNNLKKRLVIHKRQHTDWDWDNLIIDVLSEGTREECKQLEIEYRPTENVGWNVARGGGGFNYWQGKTRSVEDKAKISAALKGRESYTRTEATRKKQSESAKGKKMVYSEQAIINRAEAARRTHTGKTVSPETREKMRQAALRRKQK